MQQLSKIKVTYYKRYSLQVQIARTNVYLLQEQKFTYCKTKSVLIATLIARPKAHLLQDQKLPYCKTKSYLLDLFEVIDNPVLGSGLWAVRLAFGLFTGFRHFSN